MNYKNKYIPYLIGEALCFVAEVVLFILAIVSGSTLAIILGAVATVACAIAASWVGLKAWSASPHKAKTPVSAKKEDSDDKPAPITSTNKEAAEVTSIEIRYKKITVEALLRSLFCGLAVAFCVNFILGTIFWIIGMDGKTGAVVGALCGALVGVTLVAAAVFYLLKFKPDTKDNARRIDETGLEERVVTMLDYKDSDTLMARVQREDAMRALKTVDEKAIKFKFAKKMFITLAICAFLGLALSTMAILSAAGLLPSGSDIVDRLTPEEPPVYVPVSYIAEDGGYIDGEEEQLVLLGENAEPVVAIPDDGYTFEGWDDGYKKPTRNDKEIDHPLVLVAIFLPIEDENDDQGDEGPPDENGDQPGEQEGEGDQEGESDQEGDSDSDSDTPSDSGSGKYDKANQIINGETYYREFLEEYRDKVMELLKKNVEELTEEEKAIIEAYINIV